LREEGASSERRKEEKKDEGSKVSFVKKGKGRKKGKRNIQEDNPPEHPVNSLPIIHYYVSAYHTQEGQREGEKVRKVREKTNLRDVLPRVLSLRCCERHNFGTQEREGGLDEDCALSFISTSSSLSSKAPKETEKRTRPKRQKPPPSPRNIPHLLKWYLVPIPEPDLLVCGCTAGSDD
jgi:hypothetical protein